MKLLVDEMPKEKHDCIFCYDDHYGIGDMYIDPPRQKCEFCKDDCLLNGEECPYLKSIILR